MLNMQFNPLIQYHLNAKILLVALGYKTVICIFIFHDTLNSSLSVLTPLVFLSLTSFLTSFSFLSTMDLLPISSSTSLIRRSISPLWSSFSFVIYKSKHHDVQTKLFPFILIGCQLVLHLVQMT